MNFKEYEAVQLNDLAHINGHVSYLLTCDSKASDDPNELAIGNIIAYYDKDNELIIENGYDLKKRTSLAKEIRKKAKDSLKSHTDRMIRSKLRMELSYLEGLTDDNFNTDEGFNDMVNYVVSFIERREKEGTEDGEQTFLYVFHKHQQQMPHVERFVIIK